MTIDNTGATHYTIYHNPKCSKSRATLALLEAHNITPVVVRYLDTPPSREILKQILLLLGLQPRDVMRRKESVYTDLNLDREALSENELLQAITQHPILLERPIVVKQDEAGANTAAIGRPPENVLKLL
ncbi:MAG: arsenate reductase (glutaredoxin) [Pseudomonadaceae bacterium]|nr:arsenate reductase (glutaredoxin) [Pseudomonadaceae bacterium]